MTTAPRRRVPWTRTATWDAFRHVTSFAGVQVLALVAALGLVWHSAAAPVPVDETPLGVHAALALFLVTVGFRLTWSLTAERDRTGDIDERAALRRYAVAGLPPYLLSVAIWLLANVALGSPEEDHTAAYLTLSANWLPDPGWTGTPTLPVFAAVAAAAQFALVWPFLLRQLRRLGGRDDDVLAGAVLIVLLGTAVVTASYIDGVGGASVSLWVRIMAGLSAPLLLGAVLPLMLRDRITFERSRRALAAPTTSALAVVTLMLAARSLPELASALLAGLLVVAVAAGFARWSDRVLGTKAPTRSGVLGYAVILAAPTAGLLTTTWRGPGGGLVSLLLMSVLTVVIMVVLDRVAIRPLERWAASGPDVVPEPAGGDEARSVPPSDNTQSEPRQDSPLTRDRWPGRRDPDVIRHPGWDGASGTPSPDHWPSPDGNGHRPAGPPVPRILASSAESPSGSSSDGPSYQQPESPSGPSPARWTGHSTLPSFGLDSEEVPGVRARPLDAAASDGDDAPAAPVTYATRRERREAERRRGRRRN